MFTLHATRSSLRTFIGALVAVLFLTNTPLAQVGSVIEDVKLSSTSGNLPFALSSFEEFGSGLASLGDINGDGFLEIACGSPMDDSSGTTTGAIQILSLFPDGTVLGGLEITEGTNGFTGDLDSLDLFGTSVAAIGDVNGDGVPDLAIGAIGDDDGAANRGAVWILFLQPSGKVLATQKISSTQGGFGGFISTSSSFGRAVAGIGDLDGDGIPDLAVGDPGKSFTQDMGKVWLLFLNADGTVKIQRQLDFSDAELTLLLANGDRFGFSLAGIGDLDGDGIGDLCVGAPLSDIPGTDAGFVLVITLGATGDPLTVTTVDLSGVLSGVSLTLKEFGSSLGTIGDVDGDGTLELAVGASKLDFTADSQETWILSLDGVGVVTDYFLINPAVGNTSNESGLEEQFGRSAAGIGDLDGDGLLDLVVGAPGSDDGLPDAGAIFLLRLSDGDPVAAFTFQSTVGCAPLSVAFTDASTGTSALAWSWDFGDGTVSTQQDPTHVYLGEGTFTVSLTVSGADGDARKLVRDAVTVQGVPSVDFSASSTTGAPPLTIAFTDESSLGATAWAWDFGDGGTSTLQNPTNAYLVPGTFDVTLTTTCSGGADTETKLDYIVVSGGVQAMVISNNGSGFNPDILISLKDPELGVTWMGQVDGGSVGVSGLTFFVAYKDPLIPGFSTFFGELLIDPGSPFIALNFGVLIGGISTHNLVIANDVQLIGFTFSGQVLLNSVSGAGALTNRLDFLLGL